LRDQRFSGQSDDVAAAYDLIHMTDHRGSPKPVPDPVRARRLRRDAQRPMSTNLAEGIALSHKLLSFTGVARGR